MCHFIIGIKLGEINKVLKQSNYAIREFDIMLVYNLFLIIFKKRTNHFCGACLINYCRQNIIIKLFTTREYFRCNFWETNREKLVRGVCESLVRVL